MLKHNLRHWGARGSGGFDVGLLIRPGMDDRGMRARHLSGKRERWLNGGGFASSCYFALSLQVAAPHFIAR